MLESDNSSSFIWPPQYIVTHHPRARHVKLKASLQRGLELVVPMRFNVRVIPEILEKHKSWIEKKLHKIHAIWQQNSVDPFPEKISLPAIEQTWPVHYLKSHDSKLQLIVRPQQELVFMGDITNQTLFKKLLTAWLKSQAKRHLVARLQTLSEQTKLLYQQVTIRGQRSRWGSCSTHKSISLNYKLLFLPAHLVTHILIHELCHTVHLNHSAKFWRLLSTFDPHWKHHHREVRQTDHWVPLWAQ